MIRARALVAVAAVLGSLAAPVLTSVAEAAPPTFHAAAGLSVVSATAHGSRTWKVVVRTSALSEPVHVDVLLPAGYDDSTASYPVLYLFHGTSGGADDWINTGNAVAATAPYPLIVVMPDAGYDRDGGGWFTNWVDERTALGASRWETFHVDQLVPWVDANLRTIPDRNDRGIAGLSQGGFGSFTYAARHPDTFGSAASFSGAPDIASNPVTLGGAAVIVEGTALGLDRVEPDAMFGNPLLNTINWEGHNPASLVTNLGNTQLELWSGNGVPGPLDTASAGIVPDVLIEGAVHASSVSFAQAASRAHIPYTFDDYGPGTHSWGYWARDLAQYLPILMHRFANPVTPTSVTYRSIDRTWRQWGWTVANQRAAASAFSGLLAASVSGVTVASATPTTVTTPADFTPGARYRVTARGGSIDRHRAATVTAASDGRLTLSVRPSPLLTQVVLTWVQL